VATGSNYMTGTEVKLSSHAARITDCSIYGLGTCVHVPIRWNWEPLRGTKQGQIISTNAIVPGLLCVARKFRFLRGDWFWL